MDNDVLKIRQKFYDSENNLVLPHNANCYLNWQSREFGNTTMDTKLRELGFLLSQGFNLRTFISEYKSERDTYKIRSIRQTFIFYIMYLRYRDYYHLFSEILEELSETKITYLFIDELNLLYNPTEHEIKCMFWNDNIVIDKAKEMKGNQSDRNKLIDLITTSKMIREELINEKEK